MIREVDLVSYLPPFMQTYKEPVVALEAENPEFVLVWKAADKVLKNHFISTADEYGISRFEKLLGIFPESSESIETRRVRVMSRWFYSIPYTIRMLSLKLLKILGKDYNFSIWSNFKDGYELILTVYTINDSQVAELRHVLDVMVPENIITSIIFEDTIHGSMYFGGVMSEADILEIRQR